MEKSERAERECMHLLINQCLSKDSAVDESVPESCVTFWPFGWKKANYLTRKEWRRQICI